MFENRFLTNPFLIQEFHDLLDMSEVPRVDDIAGLKLSEKNLQIDVHIKRQAKGSEWQGTVVQLIQKFSRALLSASRQQRSRRYSCRKMV
ncbi:hypothetical protein [Desulfotalea psychrophila]|uniref:Uncharacterized protein n=1 Tax=Desulfotalea psychrophila (strain LSv54 / DSM 12343) TaxID=177439 RepID=Q6AP00_DESPS|nr:hypothetical protein [Desulfotalea psychrophila]CAG35924.1 unknown protein [Desulfotalea psychrophila LSv54]